MIDIDTYWHIATYVCAPHVSYHCISACAPRIARWKRSKAAQAEAPAKLPRSPNVGRSAWMKMVMGSLFFSIYRNWGIYNDTILYINNMNFGSWKWVCYKPIVWSITLSLAAANHALEKELIGGDCYTPTASHIPNYSVCLEGWRT